jgi:hypothetical protein
MLGSAVRFFVGAVVYGFGVSLGSALFKKVQDRIGLGEPKAKESAKSEAEKPVAADPGRDVAPDPDLPS